MNAKTLLENDNAVMIFGPASATLTLDMIPHAKRLSAPIVGVFSGADTLRVPGGTQPFVFRASYGDELQKLSSFWTAFGVTKAAVVFFDDEVGKQNYTSAQLALKKSGVEPSPVAVKRNAKITPADISRLTSVGAQGVINTTSADVFSDVYKGLRTSQSNMFAATTSFAGVNAFISQTGALGAGVVVSHVVPAPTNANVPVVSECRTALAAIGVKTFTLSNIESCISAKIVVEAMRRQKKVTRESVTQSLDTFGRYDAGGYIVDISKSQRASGSYVDVSIVTKHGTLRN
jgi:branched-chain amino acid transport system substrate-binding protein